MEITVLLQRVHEGDQEALREVIPLVYDELKKLAASHLRREHGATPLETTSLVHEAFLRLAGGRHPAYEGRAHFYGIASRLMRQILVDGARARSAAKRSGGEQVTLEDVADEREDDLLALDQALARLEAEDPMKARLVEMRYFGGMTAEESAAVAGLPVEKVRRDLRLAQAWLRKELGGQRRPASRA
jgi:RNA polymerase sigma factor (TIGR02999 family)